MLCRILRASHNCVLIRLLEFLCPHTGSDTQLQCVCVMCACVCACVCACGRFAYAYVYVYVHAYAYVYAYAGRTYKMGYICDM